MNNLDPNPLTTASETSAHGEIQRHSAGARFLHWAMALCFIVAMCTGLSLYWRSILNWAIPLFGGKEMAINLHFWFGLGLGVSVLLLFFLWRAVARWTPTDSHFVKNLSKYAASPDQAPPPETGFFNGGQKLYFWSVVISTFVLVVTGVVWWYRKQVPPNVYVVCRTTHRVLSVIMSGALLIHVYKATVGEPGTFRSMIGGKVTREWARLRRPKWFREIAGRD